MKIDRKLNFILEVERDEGKAFVYATPLHRLVFEKYFEVITETQNKMMEKGPEWLLRMGPLVAKLMLKKVAEEAGIWGGMEGVERGVLAEIRRTTSVLMPTDAGWDAVPLQHALDTKFFEPEDAEEVENAVVFFTVGCASMKRAQRDPFMEAASVLWGASVTSLPLTEYQSSLPMPNAEENIGEKVRQSSIPR